MSETELFEKAKEIMTDAMEKTSAAASSMKDNAVDWMAEAKELTSAATTSMKGTTKDWMAALKKQQDEIQESGSSEKAFEVTCSLVASAAAMPGVRVDRVDFLLDLYAKSPLLDDILNKGPQAVFSAAELRHTADRLVFTSTMKTAAASFVAGLPSSLLLSVAATGADLTQFYAFALNLAQKIAYLYGEAQILPELAPADVFTNGAAVLPEEAQARMISYLGAMTDVPDAVNLIAETSHRVGDPESDKAEAAALTKGAWTPGLTKVGSALGVKVTQKGLESVASKSVPVVGGVLSGGITYAVFHPMGEKLADAFEALITGSAADASGNGSDDAPAAPQE